MKSFILKSTKIIALVVLLTFSTNSNATTSNVVLAANASASYVNLSTVSVKIHALTWGSFDWEKFKKWWKDIISSGCGVHGSSCSGSCGSSTTPGGGGTSIPLDGGLSILALGAAAFGIRKLRNNKKEKL